MNTKLIILVVLALQGPVFADSAAPSKMDYTVHEWGTFTSVQGSDGKLIAWNPLLTSKLPAFVYDRSKPCGHPNLVLSEGKRNLLAWQRMETPVIYFYGTSEQAVDVTVRFPKGLITEWYPYASGIGPSWVKTSSAGPQRPASAKSQGAPEKGLALSVLNADAAISDSVIRWSGIRLRGQDSAGPKEFSLPAEGSNSHYYTARETDSAVLEVSQPARQSPGTETEKFLFYRGLGNFQTPLSAMIKEARGEGLDLANTGTEELPAVFIVTVRQGKGAFKPVGPLPSGQTISVAALDLLKPLDQFEDQLAAALSLALQGQGLFRREAESMVRTWRDSWFEEDGSRILYLLPRRWTDEVLPMALTPQPRQIVRVMVGRAECITPHLEKALAQQVTRFQGGDPAVRAQAVKEFLGLNLGRFAEPAIGRSSAQLPSPELSQAAWDLLAASRAAAPDAKGIAQK